MFVGAFAAAVVGGAFGAFLNKIAPIVSFRKEKSKHDC
jgi:hypothetical protein